MRAALGETWSCDTCSGSDGGGDGDYAAAAAAANDDDDDDVGDVDGAADDDNDTDDGCWLRWNLLLEPFWQIRHEKRQLEFSCAQTLHFHCSVGEGSSCITRSNEGGFC